VDAVYVAIPHNLHQQVYCDAIEAGKHLMGEKPFGIDKPANDAILECIEKHPDVFVRCSSEFPFFPAVQRICRMIDSDAFGQLLEVNGFFQHSSDLNPDKAINWKRMIDTNGEYGCMGDLGMHVCHIPFRAGWLPQNVRAVLSNVMTTRPDASGERVPCETWDNATLLCEAAGTDGMLFPLTLKTQRIAPGETNSWSLEIKGTKACARFSTKNPRRLEVLEYDGGEQVWGQLDMGHETAFKSITGGIFEFGFSDGILQMWAAFVHELAEGSAPGKFAGCATPQETAWSHILFTAALESQARQTVVEVELS
jgi:predicted dehydrogenase